jgi:hypothetical protein
LIASPGILLDAIGKLWAVPPYGRFATACTLALFPGTDSVLLRHRIGGRVVRDQIVPGKKYLTEQAATLLRFAKATTDPDIAAGYLAKAADLSARSEAAPDASPKAPDVEQPEG